MGTRGFSYRGQGIYPGSIHCVYLFYKLSESLQIYHNSTEMCVHAAYLVCSSYAELHFMLLMTLCYA
jgi:hypothetical protein